MLRKPAENIQYGKQKKKTLQEIPFFRHEEKTQNDLPEGLDAFSFLCDEKTQEDLPVGLYYI